MRQFMQHHEADVNGSLSGWDRIGLRGTIRWLANVTGLGAYLATRKILLKDFSQWAQHLTSRIRQSCEQVADGLGIHKEYLKSSNIDKEAKARQIAKERGIETGPVCMLSVVEPSYSPTVVGNRATGRLEVEMRHRRCVWIYFYWNDPQLGFGHLRLESWLPFTIKGCINGRHWLERSLLAENIDYIKQDNCFRWVKDCKRAQELLDAQLRTPWPDLLNGLAQRYFPITRDLFGDSPLDYYWSADESEWASDIMFRNTKRLDRLFPMLARHGLVISDSDDVMRFLGRIGPQAALPPRLSGDVRGDRRRRYEGICVKHRVGKNSVKTYNKAGNVLRVETAINATRDYKVFRKPDDDETRSPKWLAMRKGMADMERRARVSHASNERYLNALSACETDATLCETIQAFCTRTQANGRCVRGLNPYSPTDFHLLKFLAQGQWAINGLRNRDLAHWINPQADDLPTAERKKLSSKASRLLSILKSHGLIHRVAKTHRYQLTMKGVAVASMTVSASTVQAKQLMKLAA